MVQYLLIVIQKHSLYLNELEGMVQGQNPADSTIKLKISVSIGSRFQFLVRLYDLGEAIYCLHRSVIICFSISGVTCMVGFQPQQYMVIRT